MGRTGGCWCSVVSGDVELRGFSSFDVAGVVDGVVVDLVVACDERDDERCGIDGPVAFSPVAIGWALIWLVIEAIVGAGDSSPIIGCVEFDLDLAVVDGDGWSLTVGERWLCESNQHEAGEAD